MMRFGSRLLFMAIFTAALYCVLSMDVDGGKMQNYKSLESFKLFFRNKVARKSCLLRFVFF